MPAPLRPGYARVIWDEVAWEQDLASATARARDVAESTRRRLERDGQDVRALRPCDAEGPDGTRLPNCLKIYLPPPAGPWGIIYEVVRRPRGQLVFVAFGLRHPPRGTRPSVYAVADARLAAERP
jgi:hypothetical protein